jgi:hypothetical protein
MSARLARALACVLALLATARLNAADGVKIALEAFGALRAFRPGDVTGLCVTLRSERAEPIECVVQWDLPNADGDSISHARVVALAPSQPKRVWLYARLRPSESTVSLASELQLVRVFERRDGARVRELGSARVRPSDAARPSEPVEMTQGLVSVIGDDRMGLETLDAQFGSPEVPSMNEPTRVLPGVRIDELPDRWEGLSSASAIVWSSGDPGSLDLDRGAALLGWIERGGHLVIVLPEIGDPWSLRGSASHALASVLPTRGVRRAEGVEVEGLMPILCKGGDLRNASLTTNATLFDPATLDRGWKPLVWLPGAAATRETRGSAVSSQRTWGHGRITLIGIDLPALHARALLSDGFPQADAFWNRVLGRRADTPTTANYASWQAAKPSQLIDRPDRPPFMAGEGAMVLERIGSEGTASKGALAVLLFFACYWMVAVPGAWWYLRARQRLSATWPAFVIVAVVASPIAWGLGLVFGGADVQVRHLSVADWVLPTADDGEGERPRRLRVNAWLSVLLGGFGTTPIELGEPDRGDDLLLDWSPPPQGNPQRFPDTASAERSVDRPRELRAPSRATTTELQAWSLGLPPPAWGRVAWVEEGRPIEVTSAPGSLPHVALRGAIRHSLPGPLHDVTLIHVTPWLYEQRQWSQATYPRIEPSGLPPRPARMMRLGSWDGGALELGQLYPDGPVPVGGLGAGSMVNEVRRLYADPLKGDIGTRFVQGFRSLDWITRMEMLSLYASLDPPDYRRNPPTDPAVVRVQRVLGRELDLSAWLTRPCLIVMGFLDDAAFPAPLRVDGEEAASTGSVLVRLVIPLPCEDRGSVRASP